MRARFLVLALLLMPAPATADWQIKPFVGLTFGGKTTFADPEQAVGKANPIVGVSGLVLGEVFGVGGDLGLAPGFFESGGQYLISSRVTTLTGDAIVAMPKRMTEYTLRPYFVGGFGLMHIQSQGRQGALPVASTLAAVDLGGGATGFLNERVGLNWEVRHFRSVGGQTRGNTFENESLSFWRATMAVTIRYGK
jgi:hypothetical protein